LAKVAQTAAGGAAVTNTMFTYGFYYLTVPLMIIIHTGLSGLQIGGVTSQERDVIGCRKTSLPSGGGPTFYLFG
jgi:uncharacterized protein YjlB